MRIALLVLLIASPAFAGGKVKDDLVFSQKSRTIRRADGSIKDSITLKQRSHQGLTTVSIERPGYWGRQETSYTKNAKGELVRKTVEGTRIVAGRADHYFIAEGDSKVPLTIAQRAKVTHTAAQPSARLEEAVGRDPKMYGPRSYDLRLGWSSGPYRAIAEKHGVDYAARVQKEDAALVDAR